MLFYKTTFIHTPNKQQTSIKNNNTIFAQLITVTITG